MAILSGFNVSLDTVNLMGEASQAAFDSADTPSGWTVVTPAQLGLAAEYRDGDYFKNGFSASAIVLQKGNDYIIAFRGTDEDIDAVDYARLADGSYINLFKPLLNAVLAAAPQDAHFSFTGASLGGGAVNNMASIAATAYGGKFADADFVAFASPNITDKSGILNLGFENDPIYKVINAYANRASSLDNLVLATDEYLAGNYDGLHPYSTDAHSHPDRGFEAVARLAASEFSADMNPDSVVIFAASDGLIQDQSPKRASTGAFYLGREDKDFIVGRAGNDHIEGFGGGDDLKGGKGADQIKGGLGADSINGGAGNDILDGGAGNDIFSVIGAEAKQDVMAGGADVDTLQVKGTSNLTLAKFDASASSIEIWQGNGMALLGDGKANSFDFSGLTSVSGLSYVDAGGGNDVLIGSSQADVLRGGAGADTITGGPGDDTLSGGGDNDTFRFGAGFGKDTITDFTEGTGVKDVIQFDQAVFADFAAVMAAAVQVGADVEIRYDLDNILTLKDVSLTAATRLVADDFAFV